MIQRVQTLFLIANVILLALLAFLPLASFTTSETVYMLRADSLINIADLENPQLVVWPIFILIMCMIFIPFIAIFLFKKRLLQIRFCIFSSVLNILYYALFFYETNLIGKEISGDLSVKYFMLLIPALTIVLNILAIKRIGQDEMLIKSLNSRSIR
ncbi:MAG: DUF4293 domain-containing protein [Bacteroidales bacterium]|nr:DUF4293 domain-containing protein [Bacteroidales bacterium]